MSPLRTHSPGMHSDCTSWQMIEFETTQTLVSTVEAVSASQVRVPAHPLGRYRGWEVTEMILQEGVWDGAPRRKLLAVL